MSDQEPMKGAGTVAKISTSRRAAELKTLIYLKGFGGAIGPNEQIFGADEQLPKGLSKKCTLDEGTP